MEPHWTRFDGPVPLDEVLMAQFLLDKVLWMKSHWTKSYGQIPTGLSLMGDSLLREVLWPNSDWSESSDDSLLDKV